MESHSHPEIIQMQVQLTNLTTKVEHHERLLVTGTDDQLSLPELVRSLTSTVNSYIKRKEQEEAEKKAEWSRWKWVIITPVVGGAIVFTAQAIIFFFKFVPLVTKLTEN